MSSAQLLSHQKVKKFFTENSTYSYNLIAKHTRVPKSKVQRVIKRFKESQSIEQKPGKGRKKAT